MSYRSFGHSIPRDCLWRISSFSLGLGGVWFLQRFFWREICYDIYIYRTRGNYLLGEEVPLDDSSCKLWILRCFALALSNEPKSFLRCGSPAALACSSLGRTRAFYGVSFTNLRQIQRLRCIIPRGIYIVWLVGLNVSHTPTRQNCCFLQRKYVLCYRYVAWQVHERVEGEYDFEGENDLVNFTELAGSLGLLVIIRAGEGKLWMELESFYK